MCREESMRLLSNAVSRFSGCLVLGLLLACAVMAQQNAEPRLRLTLEDALQRARSNSVSYQAAVTDAALAHEDKKQAAAGLLPSANYNNSAIYTEGTGVDTSVKFM